ncbi:hypothetical protein PTSG_02414 [Salpingoeca rosetta]|uniref:E2F/DP family winged-helix DNA-binding domain-containing protein n=1 Tax=Salpingoeca rosetta (strain ATCC 50818 / BSB-021) TaxID=946362 RepID=F2U249_SALR5|nr:uncharacterized protein PTSG_02414 [Salpingoeca rosetta]EGD81701.1 hypothetical protein PTSG_02414 [Salpingoeca rosetta]|eukprot:XP_004996905.1 hypothetical protein PTSG_02414 [Salpingoeca rosetta]
METASPHARQSNNSINSSVAQATLMTASPSPAADPSLAVRIGATPYTSLHFSSPQLLPYQLNHLLSDATPTLVPQQQPHQQAHNPAAGGSTSTTPSAQQQHVNAFQPEGLLLLSQLCSPHRKGKFSSRQTAATSSSSAKPVKRRLIDEMDDEEPEASAPSRSSNPSKKRSSKRRSGEQHRQPPNKTANVSARSSDAPRKKPKMARRASSSGSAKANSDKEGGRHDKSLGLATLRVLGVLLRLNPPFVLPLSILSELLQVKRRRLYEIINLLEALNFARRGGRNKLVWLGIQNFHATLATIGKDPAAAISDPSFLSQTNRSNVLARLTILFVASLIKDTRVDRLEDVADLLGEEGDPGASRYQTRLKRLYDIANFLCTIGLVNKVFDRPRTASGHRKPSFVWTGRLRNIPGLDTYNARSEPSSNSNGTETGTCGAKLSMPFVDVENLDCDPLPRPPAAEMKAWMQDEGEEAALLVASCRSAEEAKGALHASTQQLYQRLFVSVMAHALQSPCKPEAVKAEPVAHDEQPASSPPPVTQQQQQQQQRDDEEAAQEEEEQEQQKRHQSPPSPAVEVPHRHHFNQQQQQQQSSSCGSSELSEREDDGACASGDDGMHDDDDDDAASVCMSEPDISQRSSASTASSLTATAATAATAPAACMGPQHTSHMASPAGKVSALVATTKGGFDARGSALRSEDFDGDDMLQPASSPAFPDDDRDGGDDAATSHAAVTTGSSQTLATPATPAALTAQYSDHQLLSSPASTCATTAPVPFSPIPVQVREMIGADGRPMLQVHVLADPNGLLPEDSRVFTFEVPAQ